VLNIAQIQPLFFRLFLQIPSGAQAGDPAADDDHVPGFAVLTMYGLIIFCHEESYPVRKKSGISCKKSGIFDVQCY
jgi:hypothetical protein